MPIASTNDVQINFTSGSVDYDGFKSELTSASEAFATALLATSSGSIESAAVAVADSHADTKIANAIAAPTGSIYEFIATYVSGALNAASGSWFGA